MKEPDADREDLVEAAVSQVEVLEGCDEELGFAGFNVRRVSTRCSRAGDVVNSASGGQDTVRDGSSSRKRELGADELGETTAATRTGYREGAVASAAIGPVSISLPPFARMRRAIEAIPRPTPRLRVESRATTTSGVHYGDWPVV